MPQCTISRAAPISPPRLSTGARLQMRGLICRSTAIHYRPRRTNSLVSVIDWCDPRDEGRMATGRRGLTVIMGAHTPPHRLSLGARLKRRGLTRMSHHDFGRIGLQPRCFRAFLLDTVLSDPLSRLAGAELLECGPRRIATLARRDGSRRKTGR